MSPKQLLAYFDRIAEAPGAVPRLRRFILDLAVRGKLVEQDPSEASPKGLLRSLEARRNAEISAGRLRRIEVPEPAVAIAPVTLPTNWMWAIPDQLSALTNNALTIGPFGSNLVTSDYSTSGTALVFVADIRSEFRDPPRYFVSEQKAEELRAHSTGPGDLLITKMGDPPGDTAIYPADRPRAVITADCMKWSLEEGIAVARYLYFALRASLVVAQIVAITKGAVHQKVSLRRFRGIHLPLPPLAEQHRIVAKVDQLMALCDRLESTQAERERRRDRGLIVSIRDAITPERSNASSFPFPRQMGKVVTRPAQIRVLREAIRSLAVRGKLVEQDTGDEPASKLLLEVRAEQRRLLSDRAFQKLSDVPAVRKSHLPFGVPDHWETAQMGQLALKLGAGSTPLGGKSVYEAAGIPFIRSQNVHNTGLILDDVARISLVTHERMSGTHVQPKDILLNITGASIGRCVLVNEDLGEANVSQHVAIVRLFLPAIRGFLHLALTSPPYQKLIDDVQVGVSRAGLSMERLRLFPVPLPPLAEQQRILAKVSELLALCDRLEGQLATAQTESKRLLESVLHQALASSHPSPTLQVGDAVTHA